LCEFDDYFEGRGLEDQDNREIGTLPYISPQLRECYASGTKFNPFKADVYSLAMTAIVAASFAD